MINIKQSIRVAIFCILLSGNASHAAGTKQPNILIILADDLGYADTGFNGGTDIPTPAIDSIAKNGVHFTAGYVTAPECAPSRSGLLSGRDQNRFGCGENADLDRRGITLLPLLTGKAKPEPRTLIWGFPHLSDKPVQYVWAVRQGDWKLVKESIRDDQGGYTGETKVGLYRLDKDIAESTDLSAQHPEKRRELQAAYDAWNATLPEPLTEGKAGQTH